MDFIEMSIRFREIELGLRIIIYLLFFGILTNMLK